MELSKITQVALLLVILCVAYIIFPAYATANPITVEASETLILYNIPVHVKRYDIYQFDLHLVKFEINFRVGNSIIFIKSDPYPAYKLTEASPLSTDPMPKYRWDEILFVKAPGNSTHWVKYDHPDNYDTYYRGEVNRDYYLSGNSKYHHHIAKWRVEKAISDLDFWTLIGTTANTIGGAIAFLLAIPLVGKIVLIILALIASVWGVGRWFIQNVIQTELGDGWAWTWGHGKWELFGRVLAFWWWMSFGLARDLGFFIFVWNIFGGGGGSCRLR
ncbi:MAG: hypothetical protein ACPLW8_05195 [Candidatus Bathyarchaeales archaeon]